MRCCKVIGCGSSAMVNVIENSRIGLGYESPMVVVDNKLTHVQIGIGRWEITTTEAAESAR
jgi:hypothetical protein